MPANGWGRITGRICTVNVLEASLVGGCAVPGVGVPYRVKRDLNEFRPSNVRARPEPPCPTAEPRRRVKLSLLPTSVCIHSAGSATIEPTSNDLKVALPEDLVDELARRVAHRIGANSGPEPWVGVARAAGHLDCKPQRIYDLVHRQDETRIPHRKEGGRLLFKLSELDRWIERGRA